MTRRLSATTAVGAMLLIGAGCQDLHVEYVNQPDRERALKNPGDVYALISTTFTGYYSGLHGQTNQSYMMPAVGNETTTHIATGGAVENSMLPRVALRNEPALSGSTDPTGPLSQWRQLYEMVSSTSEGLQLIEDGMTFTELNQDVTERTRAFAIFVQGLTFGHLSMAWDRVELITYKDRLPGGDVHPFVISHLKPYAEGLQTAIELLDEAIAIAEVTPFAIPAPWFRNATGVVTNTYLVEVANSYAAKFLVYGARTPAERAAVDWDEVLRRTELGVTRDFGPTLGTGSTGVSSGYWDALQRNTAACISCHRIHYDVVGPADQSGRYQTWYAASLSQRNRFEIVTPDRRVTGPTPTSNGSYIRYLADNNGFQLNRGNGAAQYTAYQWFRRSGAAQQGSVPLMSVDENNLLRAEALYRKGRFQEAAELINITRTRQHTINNVVYNGLPPIVVTNGANTKVPTVSGQCVPRKATTGECGDLWDALVYERRLELAGVDVFRSWADNRGLGVLPEGTWIQLPTPGRELLTLRLRGYTYGGIGGNCAAGSACEIPPLEPLEGGIVQGE